LDLEEDKVGVKEAEAGVSAEAKVLAVLGLIKYRLIVFALIVT